MISSMMEEILEQDGKEEEGSFIEYRFSIALGSLLFIENREEKVRKFPSILTHMSLFFIYLFILGINLRLSKFG